MAGNHTLGTIRGTIEIDYDGKGIVRAIKDVDKAKTSGDKLDGTANKILGSFAKVATGLAKTGSAVNLVTGAVHAVVGVLSVAGPLAAAAFATAPAIVLSLASALAVMKIATAGVGDALSTAAEGGKKFDEALAKLSPQAKSFVLAYQKAIPVLKSVKDAMQDAFFNGTDKQVAGVVNNITRLKPAATAVAGSMGDVAQNIVKTATSGANLDKIRIVLSGVNDFLKRIKTSIGPVITGFLSIGSQASEFGDVLGGKLNSGLSDLAKWLSSIDLTSLFATAKPIVAALGGLFTDLGSIVKSIFGTISGADGAQAVSVLGALVSQLADFLASAAGQQAITALGQALAAIGASTGPVFLALLQALGPALVTLAPAVATLASQLSAVLVTAINALNPLLQSLAGFLADNIGWVGPLAIAITAAAGAYKVYAAAVTAVSAVQGVLKSKAVASTAAWIANTASIVANKVATAASAVATGVTAVAAWAASTAAIVANRVAMAASAVAMGVVKAATLAWSVAQAALNVIMSLNPFALVVIAIIALVAAIVIAYKNSETFRNIVQAVWGAIKTAILAVVSYVTGTVVPALQAAWSAVSSAVGVLVNFVVGYFKLMFSIWASVLNAIKAAATAVWGFIVGYITAEVNLIRAVISAVVNAIRAVWNAWLNGIKALAAAVWSAIVSVISSAINRVKSAINGIKAVIAVVRNAFTQVNNAIKEKLSAAVSAVRGLASRITGALGNLGSLLYSKGVSLVQGFINGIKSMIGRVRNVASNVVSAVTDFLPGSPAKTGPLSGRGYALLRARRMMADIARGINDGAQEPATAMLGAIEPISGGTDYRGPQGRSGKPQAGPANIFTPEAGNRTYRLVIDGKPLADFVTDTVTGHPIIVANANKEGSRRSAWAGSGR